MESTETPPNGSELFLVRWNNPDGGLTEGPLTLLWDLIESYKVDIFDVSLSRITQDFLSFLQISSNTKLELRSEFVVMAAHLVYLKSRALLPNPGYEEEDSDPTLPAELVNMLLEHKKYKMLSLKLSDLDKITSGTFRRPSSKTLDTFTEGEGWLDLSLIEMISAFHDLIRESELGEEEKRIWENTQEFSVDEKIEKIQHLFQEKNEIFFSELFDRPEPKIGEIVSVFLAILEIVKLRRIRILQNQMFGDIKLVLTDNDGREGQEIQ